MTGSLVVPFFRALFAMAVRPRPFLRDNVFNKRECALDALEGGDGERETPRRRGNSDREKRERGGIACYSPKRRYGILYTQAGDSRESEPKGCVSEKLELQLWNGERSRRYICRDARGLESSLKLRARVSSVPRRSKGDSEGGTMKL